MFIGPKNPRNTISLGDLDICCPTVNIPDRDQPWPLSCANVIDAEAGFRRGLRFAFRSRRGGLIDIGANFGQTLIRCLYVDRTRPYRGFEPNIQCSAYMDQLIAINNLTNHIIIPIALSNSSSLVDLLIREDAGSLMGTSSIIPNFRPKEFYSTNRKVPAMLGDLAVETFCPGLEICAIKIDVEGAEAEVLEGLSRTIQANRPYLFFEILPNFLVATGQKLSTEYVEARSQRARRLSSLFDNMGYRIYRLDEDGNTTAISTLEPSFRSDLSETAYFAAPLNITIPPHFEDN